MSNFARADARTQWFARAYPGATIDPHVGVIHTTEGMNWPDYGGGASAPNYTAKPDCEAEKLLWRAHFPDEMSSRALRNESGGVDTNTEDALQVELIGTCAPATRDAWERLGYEQDVDFIFWPDAPEWALREVAAFVADMYKRHSIPITAPAKRWLAYPASYGVSNDNRLTFSEWNAYKGWLGHQHVPENTHGDPGALWWEQIAEYAREIIAPPKKPQRPAPARAAIITGKKQAAKLREAEAEARQQGRNTRARIYKSAAKGQDAVVATLQRLVRR